MNCWLQNKEQPADQMNKDMDSEIVEGLGDNEEEEDEEDEDSDSDSHKASLIISPFWNIVRNSLQSIILETKFLQTEIQKVTH